MAKKQRSYYTMFDPAKDGSWFFWIPEEHGPFPGEGHGDILTGPYHNYDDAYRDAMTCQTAAIKHGLPEV